MAGQPGHTELTAGSVLLLAGAEWTVTLIEPQHGRVLLRAGGEERWRSIRWLAHHPDCQPVPDDAAGPGRPAGQPPDLDDLSDYQRQVLWLRVGHLLEAETGFRGGDPLRPGPGEPRPAYDPRATTLGQRRRAKAAELKALGGGEAAMLGLGQVSEWTLERMAAAWKDRGPAGCIDGRWVRAGGGHPPHHRGSTGGDLRGPEGDPEAVQDQHEGQAGPDRPVRCRALRAAGLGPGVLDAAGCPGAPSPGWTSGNADLRERR